MLNVIEDKFMVNSINDVLGLKFADSDNHLKSKQQETQGTVVDNDQANKVSISSTSKQLEALKASLRDIPEINEARVLYFKAELQAGNYQIHSNKIARSMLNDVEIA